MTFGREHVQPAEPDHLVVLGLNRRLGHIERRQPRRFIGLRVLDRREPLLGQRRCRHEFGVSAEHDVGSATGHVRRDRDGPAAAGLRHDGSFPVVVLGVQYLVGDTILLEQLAQVLGLLNARRSDEDGLAVLMALDDVDEHGVVFCGLGAVDQIGIVEAHHRTVRGDRHDPEVVDLRELRRLGHGGTGHASQTRVEPEEVLQGDRGKGLVLRLDLHALLGLDRLVQALVVPATGEDAAGVLVDDEHLAVDDDVVAVLLEELLRPNRIVEKADQRSVHRVVEVVDAELVLDLVDR
ncbi:unannotated protein [freshwater metagenome]|uniref:Unannotated protein n=1 Tax=freshwater metagenome TaxID=449393 RepID=A0A6J7IKP7_9ZZZZ